MPKPSTLANRYQLPSGRQVIVRHLATPGRPWEPHGDADCYVVRREKVGARNTYNFFSTGQLGPLVLDARDAEALAAILNGRSRPQRRRAPASAERDR